MDGNAQVHSVIGVIIVILIITDRAGGGRHTGAEPWPLHREVPDTQDEGSSLLGRSVSGCAGSGSPVL